MNDTPPDVDDLDRADETSLLERVRRRLSRLDSEPGAIPEQLEECLERIESLGSALEALDRRVATTSRDDDLRNELLDARDRECDRLARLVVDWMRSGGELQLIAASGGEGTTLAWHDETTEDPSNEASDADDPLEPESHDASEDPSPETAEADGSDDEEAVDASSADSNETSTPSDAKERDRGDDGPPDPSNMRINRKRSTRIQGVRPPGGSEDEDESGATSSGDEPTAARDGDDDASEASSGVTSNAAEQLDRTMGPKLSLDRNDTTDEYRIAATILPDVISTLGSPPSEFNNIGDVGTEIGMLTKCTEPEELEQWAMLPDEVQVALASYVAARARHLQQELGASLSGYVRDSDLGEIFPRLNQHMKTHQPGHAHGLALDHDPKGETWADDTEHWKERIDAYGEKYYGRSTDEERDEVNDERALDRIERALEADPEESELRDLVGDLLARGLSADDPRLVEMMAPVDEAFADDPDFKDLRNAISESRISDTTETSDDPTSRLPDDWPLRERVAGLRAVVTGGDRRPEARERIEEAFQFENLNWYTGRDMRRIQSLTRRIEQGSVDLVLILRDFISHKAADAVADACDGSDARPVWIDSGYGVSQIRLALERFLEPEPAE